MAGLIVDKVSKRFGRTEVLSHVSADVKDGEFLAVLGPSGCGKTTLLRLIAGFEKPNGGRIAIGGRDVAAEGLHVPPEERNVGIVFQSYALWPHMNVAENVGYALRVKRRPAAEAKRRVDEALAVVGLSGFGARAPAQLSGGQRQRVALARCLVQEPRLVLLDEPLANLDVHLRASMEEEFARFHERSGATMIYITHDQAEAMALADRIAVMDQGRIVQVATPATLYREPASEMIATFIGGGMAVDADYLAADGEGRAHVRLFGATLRVRSPTVRPQGAAVRLALSPRALLRVNEGEGFACRVTRLVYLGGRHRIDLAVEAAPDQHLVMETAEDVSPAQGERIHVTLADGWIIPESA